MVTVILLSTANTGIAGCRSSGAEIQENVKMLPTYRSYGATHKVGHKRKGGSPGLITKYCNRNQIEMLIKKRNHAFYAGLSGYPGKCSTMMRLVTTINMQLDCQLDRMPE